MLITVKVFSESLYERILQISHHQRFEIYVKEKAKDGEANMAVRNIIARHFKILPSKVHLIRGGRRQNKIFEIDK